MYMTFLKWRPFLSDFSVHRSIEYPYKQWTILARSLRTHPPSLLAKVNINTNINTKYKHELAIIPIYIFIIYFAASTYSTSLLNDVNILLSNMVAF